MLGNVKRPYRKLYRPVGMDLFDPKVHAGARIEPGSIVTVTQHNGPFRYIRDEHGNEMSVGMFSLQNLNGMSD